MIGKFVVDNRYGPAKVIGMVGDDFEIEYFFSPWNKKCVAVKKNSVAPCRLYKQTRVYTEVQGRWRMGRVILVHETDRGYDYEIQFPNKKVVRFPEKDIYTRCWTEHDDPTSTLATGGMETPFWFERRQKFTEALLAERFATRGLKGILSSRIDLVPHQIEVARRVLEDPLQRYLLADEVGMGKTIEAGLIIRQHLLSTPNGNVSIVVPGPLVRQWEEELQSKFMIEEFDRSGQSRVSIVSSDRMSEIIPNDISLLVIDEAHHLVSRDIPEELLRLAQISPRLLLLSATPSLGKADILLRLLQLLDPSCYEFVDLKEFTSRLENLDQYGVFLRGLRVGATLSVLNQRLDKLPKLFAGDSDVLDLGKEVRRALEINDDTEIKLRISALRAYIADVYRIHQRLIRTRRQDVPEWFFPRGPVVKTGSDPNLEHVRLVQVSDSRNQLVFDLFEEWRIECLTLAHVVPSTENDVAVNVSKLFDAIGAGVESVGTVMSEIPKELMSEETRELFKKALLSTNPTRGRAKQIAQDVEKYIEELKRDGVTHPRIAVFGSDEEDVKRSAIALRDLIGAERVLYSGEMDYSRDDISRVFMNIEDAQVLFCGRQEEEGINLHYMNALVHLDLPFSPARIEQRIGRLDRFGRTLHRICQVIYFPALVQDSNPWIEWYNVLAKGFKVFNEPIADVQFALDELSYALHSVFLNRGSMGLPQIIPQVQERIEQERGRLDAQYALNGVLQHEELAGGMYDNIEEFEDNEDGFAMSTMGWVSEVLNLPVHGDILNKACFSFNEDTLLPPWPWLECFNKHGFRQMHTFRRQKALKEKEQPKLLRRGNLLMRCIEYEYQLDDRGTAFGIWRNVLTEDQEEFFAFRLCYVIESGLPNGLGRDEKEGCRARLDGYLPPWSVSFFVDGALNVINDNTKIDLLSLRYDKHRDSNLGSRLNALFELIDEAQFCDLCNRVREESESSLRQQKGFTEALTTAIMRATLDIDRRNRRLRQRISMGVSHETGLSREIELNSMMLKAIHEPKVRLDAMGVIVLSSRSPIDL